MKKSTLSSVTKFVAALAAIGFSASTAVAQTTFQWDPSGLGGNGSDVNGTWDAGTALNWTQGSTTKVVWGNATNDIANFGSTATANNVTVTLGASINAGGINFNDSEGSYGYTIQSSGANKTITSANSTFNINFANSNFFTRNAINSINFSGSSTYQFIGAVNNLGSGVGSNFSSDNFNGNVILGQTPGTNTSVATNAIDTGTLAENSSSLVTAGNTIQVNQAWTVYNGAQNTDAYKLDGLGNRGNGALAFAGGSPSYSGNIQLLADSTIFGTSTTSSTNLAETISGVISGSANLTLGFWNGSSNSTGFVKELVGNASSSNTGATVIINYSGGLYNKSATQYQLQRVALTSGGLSSATTLVLGANAYTAAVTGATKLSSEGSSIGGGSGTGVNTGDMVGVFDLNSYNQTVAGLTTGAGLSVADVALNVIGNSGNANSTTSGTNYTGGTGKAVLTINGGTSGTQASTYGGIIQDNFKNSGAISDAQETSTTGLAVTGGSETLTGTSNTYSGGTAVSGSGTTTKGFLYADSLTGSATGTGTVTVSGTSLTSYGVLGGGATNLISNGTRGSGITGKVFNSSNEVVTGAVTVNQFGHIAPGDATGSVATLEVGTLTLATGAQADFDFNSTSNDFVLTDGLLTLGSNIVFNLNFIGVSNEAGTYDMLGYTTDSGFNAANFSVTGLANGLSASFSDDTADGVILMTVAASSTPEPSTWAMLLGGVALLGFVIRRRSFNS